MDQQQIEKILKLAKKWIFKGFPHAIITIAGMIIVFFCIDRVNKPIGFMTNEFHKWLSFFLACYGIYSAVNQIAGQRKRERDEEMRRIKRLQAKRAAQRGNAPRGGSSRPAPKAPTAGRAPSRAPGAQMPVRKPSARPAARIGH